ncbi:hypothetical protein HOLleu_36718 [Holothuria leucospilota]|uniref:Uncharacterized protein n=1 Tax=Holothuria leucospilota TaxID=206669 RepID=A0A9Q0YMK2_HOLLE|nr:hypothetical protein HOLleu_36718 [Holothuria leucospilota]
MEGLWRAGLFHGTVGAGNFEMSKLHDKIQRGKESKTFSPWKLSVSVEGVSKGSDKYSSLFPLNPGEWLPKSLAVLPLYPPDISKLGVMRHYQETESLEASP